jgi:glycine/D-amino acid oxidase-like deaminating enzyme
MKFVSYWHDTARQFTGAHSGAVTGRYDVAIIGGGFTGLNAACKLARSGVRAALLEARHIGWGASGRNGGHMNSGMAGSFGAASRLFGEDRARRIWDAYDRSVDMIEEIVEEESIDCSFRRGGKLKLVSKPSHVARIRAMGDEIRASVDRSVRWLDRDELRADVGSDAFHGGLLYPKSAMAHMGNYATGLAEAAARHGAHIWEDAEVTARRKVANGWELQTPKGVLTAGQVILATDAYTPRMFDYVRRRIVPIASFIIATRPLTEAEVAAVVPSDRNYTNSLTIANYFRLTPDRRFLFGGRARFSGVSNQRTDTSSGQLLRKQMLSVFPQLEPVEIEYCWGGLVGATQDRHPRAGQADGTIFSAGYSGHGAQLSTLMGQALADMAMGDRSTNPLDGVVWNPVPLHWARRWTLPIVGSYYRIKDALP